MGLSADQQKAVDCPGHCLIVACPGSGKTYTLVQRAARILADSPSARVCAVTFTRAAAEEIRERLLKDLGEAVAPRITAGTFHSLALQQLTDFLGGGRRPFGIASASQTFVLIAKAREHIQRKFRMRVSVDETRRYIEYAKANGGQSPPQANAAAVLEALDYYQGHLRALKLLDFHDLIEYALHGMTQNLQFPSVPATHLLVDEFQDADAIQVEWVMAHVARGVIATCVGDDDQSIYGFRHAKGYDAMMTFASRANALRVTLDTTYRCPVAVVMHASRLIKQNSVRVAKTVRTARSIRGDVVRRDFQCLDEEVSAIGHAAQALPHGRSMAVLCRTRAFLRHIETWFLSAGIPYEGGLDGSIWTGGVPGLFRGLIDAACGRDMRGVGMALAARGLNHASTWAVREILQQTPAMDAILRDTAWTKTYSEKQEEAWAEMRPGYTALCRAVGDRGAFLDAVASFLAPGVGGFSNPKIFSAVQTLLGRMPGGLREISRAIERQETAARAGGDKPRDHDKVHLGTLHGSKGLEWDFVWMAGLRAGVLPHSDGILEEERRLAYVGVTRSRDQLVLSYSHDGRSGPSQFLDEMGLGSTLQPQTRRSVAAA